MTLVDFTGTYWNQQTFATVPEPDATVACHNYTPAFSFRPNTDVAISMENGSMRLERTSQGVRYLSFINKTCGGRRTKDGSAVLMIAFNHLVEVDRFKITIVGADNNPSGGAPFAAYLVVPRRVFPINTGYYDADITSNMIGTGGQIGPIRFARIESNRPGNHLLKFSYNISRRLGKGDIPFWDR